MNDLASPLDIAAEVRPIEWKQTGMLLGGVVVAACVLGGLAGWWSAVDVDDPPKPEQAASLSIPLAEPPPPAVTDWPGADRSVVAARPDRPKPDQISTARLKRAPAVAPGSEPEERAPESQPLASPAEESLLAEASEPDAAAAPPASPAATSLPLPNRVVARTIERIGYACGEVATTSPVEGGAPGVFKVTCTSGQSYQAKPVKGRYRFRRLGRL